MDYDHVRVVFFFFDYSISVIAFILQVKNGNQKKVFFKL